MGVLIDGSTRVLVQGLTGKEGSFHAQQCIEYGTNIVGGVTPGKGGQTRLDRPVFNSTEEAVRHTGADASVIFVPAQFAAGAVEEAAGSGIRIIVCITEGIPVRDMLLAKRTVRTHNAVLIGPNCPGIITPPESKIGIMPGYVFEKGTIGLISRSGTLVYEAADQLRKAGLGISTAVGIGGDSIIGTPYTRLLQLFEEDHDTQAVLMIGEIGGDLEERAAMYIKDHISKPVIAFVAGQTAPAEKRMGHAGAIISGSSGTAEHKIGALKDAGAAIVKSPADIGSTVREALQSRIP